jgi:hypothetical protein
LPPLHHHFPIDCFLQLPASLVLILVTAPNGSCFPFNMSANPFTLLGGLSKSPNDQRSSPAAPAASQAQPQASNSQPPQGQAHQQAQQQARSGKKRKNHRGGKKKRQRRKSFAFIDDDDDNGSQADAGGTSGEGLYRIPSANLSGASFDSEALLDHRCASIWSGRPRPRSTDRHQRSSADANAPILDSGSCCRFTIFSIRNYSKRRQQNPILT